MFKDVHCIFVHKIEVNGNRKENILQNILVYTHRRKNVIQNDMRVDKWQNVHIWVDHPFKSSLSNYYKGR